MKKIFIGLALLMGMISCENQENDFPDYTYQTIYFPIQYPVRTLALGESLSDNSIDLEHAFSIGANVGGMYENNKDRIVKISLAPELIENAKNASGNPIQLLPPEYYTLSSATEMLIPKGSFSGTIRVDLKDAFFNDPLSTDVNYVIPLVITDETADSVMTGTPVVENPDRRITADWLAGFGPKDYTLFAVKYINKYHGTYLHRGTDETLTGEGGTPIQDKTYTYQAKYIEQDLLTIMTTKSLTSGIINRLGGKNQGDIYQAELQFNDETKTINIVSATGDPAVHGTGTFVLADDSKADVWGGIAHRTLYLDYYYKVGTEFHHAKDTLVYRDNNMKYEEFTITLSE